MPFPAPMIPSNKLQRADLLAQEAFCHGVLLTHSLLYLTMQINISSQSTRCEQLENRAFSSVQHIIATSNSCHYFFSVAELFCSSILLPWHKVIYSFMDI